MREVGADVADVGDHRLVQLLDQALVDEELDHEVGIHAEIVAAVALGKLQLGIHLVVRGIVVIDELRLVGLLPRP